MKVREERYQPSGRPKIEQKDIEGGDAVVVTIAEVEEEKVKGDKGDKLLLVLVVEEFPDKVHRLNKTQLAYMVEKLGDETNEWIGQKIPLVKTTQEFGSGSRVKDFDVVWVAAPDEWDTILKAGGSKAPATRKRGKR